VKREKVETNSSGWFGWGSAHRGNKKWRSQNGIFIRSFSENIYPRSD